MVEHQTHLPLNMLFSAVAAVVDFNLQVVVVLVDMPQDQLQLHQVLHSQL